jgi:hypothetical protein
LASAIRARVDPGVERPDEAADSWLKLSMGYPEAGQVSTKIYGGINML